MANRDARVDLTELHEAIKAQLAAAFPMFKLVDYYIDEHDELTAEDMPALLFELTELETGEDHDPGTEQWATESRWEARVVLPYRTPNARLQARVLAGNLSVFLHKRNRWQGQNGGEIKVIGAFRDDFSPELDRFEVWRVEWAQCLHLGESVFADENAGDVPGDVQIRYGVESYRLDGLPVDPEDQPFPPGDFEPFSVDDPALGVK